MHLSKSQYMRGLQCPKALWLQKYRSELAAEPDARRQHLFDTGHRVGDLAKDLFPGGAEVAYRRGDYAAMVAETGRLLDTEKVIYEGSFSRDGLFVRADILVKNADAWDLYEVKATTSTKAVHKPDVAVQWYVIGQRLPLGRAYLVHLDNGYRRDGEIDVARLFAIDEVSDAVRDQQATIAANLERFERVLAGPEPDIPIGTQCDNPYECDFRAYCWREVPFPSVLDLCRMNGDKKFEYYHRGVVSYADVQRGADLNAAQTLQVDSALTRETRVDVDALREYLRDVEFPINFLDFETFQDAIPRFDGQRPYQNIPFQYSLHILHADGELEHKEHLADENGDPRPRLAAQLLDDLTETGTIFAYSQSFELGVIHGLAALLPGHDERLLALPRRFVDLLPPFRNLWYYHPDFHGSFSIKSVLPALFPDDPGLDYRNLAVQSGEVAMDIFPYLQEIEDAAEKQAARDALRAYCRLDTLAMVKIWQKLDEAIRA